MWVWEDNYIFKEPREVSPITSSTKAWLRSFWPHLCCILHENISHLYPFAASSLPWSLRPAMVCPVLQTAYTWCLLAWNTMVVCDSAGHLVIECDADESAQAAKFTSRDFMSHCEHLLLDSMPLPGLTSVSRPCSFLPSLSFPLIPLPFFRGWGLTVLPKTASNSWNQVILLPQPPE